MTEPSLQDVIRTCPHLSQSVHRTEKRREEKKGKEKERVGLNSPSLSPSVFKRLPPAVDAAVYQLLDGGVASLDLNDRGRPWPSPQRAAIASICGRYSADLCLKAAKEAREIVQAQDRAPNITALFAKKLRDLQSVRDEIRKSMEDAA